MVLGKMFLAQLLEALGKNLVGGPMVRVEG
jgi:hypothetical protein